jgi:hypothetical protein
MRRERQTLRVWIQDDANNPALIAALADHAGFPDLEVDVGSGWVALVWDCHRRLVYNFPDYQLLAVKQKWAELHFQAFPRPQRDGAMAWTDDEMEQLDAITDEFRERSSSICEWCGAPGVLREDREMELTLCSPCDARFEDPPSGLGPG